MEDFKNVYVRKEKDGYYKVPVMIEIVCIDGEPCAHLHKSDIEITKYEVLLKAKITIVPILIECNNEKIEAYVKKNFKKVIDYDAIFKKQKGDLKKNKCLCNHNTSYQHNTYLNSHNNNNNYNYNYNNNYNKKYNNNNYNYNNNYNKKYNYNYNNNNNKYVHDIYDQYEYTNNISSSWNTYSKLNQNMRDQYKSQHSYTNNKTKLSESSELDKLDKWNHIQNEKIYMKHKLYSSDEDYTEKNNHYLHELYNDDESMDDSTSYENYDNYYKFPTKNDNSNDNNNLKNLNILDDIKNDTVKDLVKQYM